MAITSANQLELLQTAEAVAREKNDRPQPSLGSYGRKLIPCR
jgi:hypothetical protein